MPVWQLLVQISVRVLSCYFLVVTNGIADWQKTSEVGQKPRNLIISMTDLLAITQAKGVPGVSGTEIDEHHCGVIEGRLPPDPGVDA